MPNIEGAYAGFTLRLQDPGLVWIRFDRPRGTHNGFTAAMKKDLTELLAELNIRPDTRVIIFTGNEEAFCAGDDFKNYYDEEHWTTARSPNLFEQRRLDELGLCNRLRFGSQKLTTALRDTDLITIAAINGACIQSGLTLALSCDFRIASPNARLGSATLRFGFLPDENGHYLLVRQIGVSRTLDFLLNNRILSADEALAWGLVNEVVERDLLEPHVEAMALRLAAGPQVATRLLKRSVYNAWEGTFHEAAEDIALRTAISDHHSDTSEGIAAWREKREPRFNEGRTPAGEYVPGLGVKSDEL
jgi:2-(1,2-epoxy-1,2-dihydrophenyl)acetyl-CoA isomerase